MREGDQSLSRGLFSPSLAQSYPSELYYKHICEHIYSDRPSREAPYEMPGLQDPSRGTTLQINKGPLFA